VKLSRRSNNRRVLAHAVPLKCGSAAATTASAWARSFQRPSGVKNSNADRARFQAASAAVA
jgi:hypothetical protein